MGFKRRRRSRRAWNWATTGSLLFQDSTVGPQIVISGPLVPAPWVEWMLEQGRGRNHITIESILLWLDFAWINNSDIVRSMSPLDFWIIKERFDSAPGSNAYQPYQSPEVPSNITSWEVNDTLEEYDGLDPFLWTHHLSELVNGSVVGNVANGGYADNTSPDLAAGSIQQPNVNVRQSWQPDVIIRSKRRLMKGDCLNIGFTGQAGTGNLVEYSLTYRARVLTS